MNVQHTERGNKWLVENLRKAETALAAILKRVSNLKNGQGRPQMKVELESIIIYYLATLAAFPLFYGFFDDNYIYRANSINLSVYFLVCSLVPLFCLAYLSCKLLLDSQNATLITKTLSVVYFVLLVNNVVMAIDAYENLEQWMALDYMDTLINGDSDWLIPLGAADAVLILIGVACLLSKSTSLEG